MTKVRSHSLRKGELTASQWKSLLGDVRQSLPRNCGHWVNPQPTRSDNYANNFTDASPPCAKNYSCTYQRPLVSLLGHLHLPNHLFTLPLQLSNAWQFRRQKLSKEPRQWQIQNRVLEKNANPYSSLCVTKKHGLCVIDTDDRWPQILWDITWVWHSGSSLRGRFSQDIDRGQGFGWTCEKTLSFTIPTW